MAIVKFCKKVWGLRLIAMHCQECMIAQFDGHTSMILSCYIRFQILCILITTFIQKETEDMRFFVELEQLHGEWCE